MDFWDIQRGQGGGGCFSVGVMGSKLFKVWNFLSTPLSSSAGGGGGGLSGNAPVLRRYQLLH